jgi:hypothetical protein
LLLLPKDRTACKLAKRDKTRQVSHKFTTKKIKDKKGFSPIMASKTVNQIQCKFAGSGLFVQSTIKYGNTYKVKKGELTIT